MPQTDFRLHPLQGRTLSSNVVFVPKLSFSSVRAMLFSKASEFCFQGWDETGTEFSGSVHTKIPKEVFCSGPGTVQRGPSAKALKREVAKSYQSFFQYFRANRLKAADLHPSPFWTYLVETPSKGFFPSQTGTFKPPSLQAKHPNPKE